MSSEEEKEKEGNNSDYIFVSDPLSYTQEERHERKQNRKKHTISAYTLFYVAQNLDDSFDGANRVDCGYWCLKKYEMEAVSLRKPSGTWVVLPTSMFQTTVKLPVEYPTATESVMVETLTGGLGTASAGEAGRGVMIQHKKSFSEDYHFDFDTDIYASKLKEEAESEGYQMIPAKLSSNNSIIPALFAMGKQKNMFEDNSKLFEDIVVNRLFSEVFPVESHPEDGSTIQRHFHAYVPRHGGEEELPPGLLPDENERKRNRLLKELGTQIEKMKQDATRSAALLEMEKIKAEEEYHKKVAEITARIREGTIEEMSRGAVYNAETHFEVGEEGKGDKTAK